MSGTPRPSTLGLIILANFVAGPVHAYRMQKLIKMTGKDKVVNVRRPASVYQTIERLLRLGLIRLRETVQTDSHPDRIVYEITEKGRVTVKGWLREILATVNADFPSFPAGVSVLALLTPDEAKEQFEIRARAVREVLAEIENDKQKAGDLPRFFLLEDAYRTALFEAELRWLQAVIADIRSGELVWDEPWLRDVAAKFIPTDFEGMP